MLALDLERRLRQVEWYPWTDSMGNHYHLPWKDLEPIVKSDKIRVERMNKIKKLNEKIKFHDKIG